MGVTSDVPRLIFLSNLSALKASVIPRDRVSTNAFGDEVFLLQHHFPSIRGNGVWSMKIMIRTQNSLFCAKEAID